MEPRVFSVVLAALAACLQTGPGASPAGRLETQPLDVSIRNARLQRLGASQDLENDMESLAGRVAETAWAGYAVPMVEGRRGICCGACGGCCAGCSLEARESSCVTDEEEAASEVLLVMYRLDRGQIDKLRIFSGDCELDAGGLQVYWWSSVNPEQSLALLESLLRKPLSRNMTSSATAAIAHHAEDQAIRILERLGLDGTREVSKDAVFWLGEARGPAGVEALTRLMGKADSKLREHIAFALHVSKAPQALSKLIETAKRDGDPEVRGKALFWLGQKAGERAAQAIASAVQDDPEVEVKEHAVFALSQLPPDEGIPMLIDVAKTHPHPRIRKKAMFWLGQSGDPRALALFEKILLGK